MTGATIALIALGSLAVGSGGGFWLGHRTRPAPDGQSAAEVAAAIADNTEALSDLAAAAVRPVQLDAETQKALATREGPIGCADSEDSLSPACLLALCWSYQQSPAGRSDASTCAALAKDARALMWLQRCTPEGETLPDWACIEKAATVTSRF